MDAESDDSSDAESNVESNTWPDSGLAGRVARAAAHGRRCATAHRTSADGDGLPWRVIEAFDAEVRGQVERDRRIEEERDRVLIAAVNLGETRPEDGPEAVESARAELVAAIDYLEQAVLRFGIVNGAGARNGLGAAGTPVASRR